ncbi:MAG: TlpA disulfide reductase family protein [Candidatus Krumholzibacteria bacterium]|nr:TlpA disulfide reductase family protein [Candidatus Krumholzibacteria bacterium]
MKTSILLTVVLFLSWGALAAEEEQPPPPSPEETTLTEVGQMAPDFTVATIDGGEFALSAQKGQVVLINWFATWCPPCKEEMPHLQTEVWEKFGAQGLVMISVAREEKADVVAPFVKKYKVTWPFGLDPERTAYAKYAEAYIPRNTVVGPDGTIIYQSNGFEMPDFEAMIKAIEEALAGQKM